ncbi:hypothetical protein [Sorangium sp. So ce1099]|uniref:hypothetical protein n=1 Tax=Sorangium sp. So ce1099 TaxID=3133331 RepID=UPI003F5FA888
MDLLSIAPSPGALRAIVNGARSLARPGRCRHRRATQLWPSARGVLLDSSRTHLGIARLMSGSLSEVLAHGVSGVMVEPVSRAFAQTVDTVRQCHPKSSCVPHQPIKMIL